MIGDVQRAITPTPTPARPDIAIRTQAPFKTQPTKQSPTPEEHVKAELAGPTIPTRRPPAEIVNPFESVFTDDQSKEIARSALANLPATTRTSLLMATDPNSKIPAAAFSGGVRELISRARVGDATALQQLASDPGSIDEVSRVNRERIGAERVAAAHQAREDVQAKRDELSYISDLIKRNYTSGSSSSTEERPKFDVRPRNVRPLGDNAWGVDVFTGKGFNTVRWVFDEDHTPEDLRRAVERREEFPNILRASEELKGHVNVNVTPDGTNKDGTRKYKLTYVDTKDGLNYEYSWTDNAQNKTSLLGEKTMSRLTDHGRVVPRTNAQTNTLIFEGNLENAGFKQTSRPIDIGGGKKRVEYESPLGIDAAVTYVNGQPMIVYNTSQVNPAVLRDFKKQLADAGVPEDQLNAQIQLNLHVSAMAQRPTEEAQKRGENLDVNTKEGKKNVDRINTQAFLNRYGLPPDITKMLDEEAEKAKPTGVVGFVAEHVLDTPIFKMATTPLVEHFLTPQEQREFYDVYESIPIVGEPLTNTYKFLSSPAGLATLYAAPEFTIYSVTGSTAVGSVGATLEEAGVRKLPIAYDPIHNRPVKIDPSTAGEIVGSVATPGITKATRDALVLLARNPASVRELPAALRGTSFFKLAARPIDSARLAVARGPIERVVPLEASEGVKITGGKYAGRVGFVTNIGADGNHTIQLVDRGGTPLQTLGKAVRVADNNLQHDWRGGQLVMEATGKTVNVVERRLQLNAKRVLTTTEQGELKVLDAYEGVGRKTAFIADEPPAGYERFNLPGTDEHYFAKKGFTTTRPITGVDGDEVKVRGFKSFKNKGNALFEDLMQLRHERFINAHPELRGVTDINEAAVSAAKAFNVSTQGVEQAAASGGHKLITPSGRVLAGTPDAIRAYTNFVEKSAGARLVDRGFAHIQEGTNQVSATVGKRSQLELIDDYVSQRVARAPDGMVVQLNVGNEHFQTTAGKLKQYAYDVNRATELPRVVDETAATGALTSVKEMDVRRVLKNLAQNQPEQNALNGLEREARQVQDELIRTGRSAEEVLESGDWAVFGREERLIADAQVEHGIPSAEASVEAVKAEYAEASETAHGWRVWDPNGAVPHELSGRIARQEYMDGLHDAFKRAFDALNSRTGIGPRGPQVFEGSVLSYGKGGISVGKELLTGDQVAAVFLNPMSAVGRLATAEGVTQVNFAERLADGFLGTLVHEITHGWEVHHIPGEEIRTGQLDEVFENAINETHSRLGNIDDIRATLRAEIDNVLGPEVNRRSLLSDFIEYNDAEKAHRAAMAKLHAETTEPGLERLIEAVGGDIANVTGDGTEIAERDAARRARGATEATRSQGVSRLAEEGWRRFTSRISARVGGPAPSVAEGTDISTALRRPGDPFGELEREVGIAGRPPIEAEEIPISRATPGGKLFDKTILSWYRRLGQFTGEIRSRAVELSLKPTTFDAFNAKDRVVKQLIDQTRNGPEMGPFYRGIQLTTKNEIVKFLHVYAPGKNVELPLSSFTKDFDSAGKFGGWDERTETFVGRIARGGGSAIITVDNGRGFDVSAYVKTATHLTQDEKNFIINDNIQEILASGVYKVKHVDVTAAPGGRKFINIHVDQLPRGAVGDVVDATQLNLSGLKTSARPRPVPKRLDEDVLDVVGDAIYNEKSISPGVDDLVALIKERWLKKQTKYPLDLNDPEDYAWLRRQVLRQSDDTKTRLLDELGALEFGPRPPTPGNLELNAEEIPASAADVRHPEQVFRDSDWAEHSGELGRGERAGVLRPDGRLSRKIIVADDGRAAINLVDHADGWEALYGREVVTDMDKARALFSEGKVFNIVSDMSEEGSMLIEGSISRMSKAAKSKIIEAARSLGQRRVSLWDNGVMRTSEDMITLPLVRFEQTADLSAAIRRARLSGIVSDINRRLRPEQFMDALEAARPILVNDPVDIIAGEHAGKEARTVKLLSKGRGKRNVKSWIVELNDGTRAEVGLHEIEPAAGIEDLAQRLRVQVPTELPLTSISRGERMSELENLIPALTGKSRRSAQKELTNLRDEEVFIRDVAERWPVEARLREELANTLEKLEKAKGKGRQVALYKKATALFSLIDEQQRPLEQLVEELPIEERVYEHAIAGLTPEIDALQSRFRELTEQAYANRDPATGKVLDAVKAESIRDQITDVNRAMAELRGEATEVVKAELDAQAQVGRRSAHERFLPMLRGADRPSGPIEYQARLAFRNADIADDPTLSYLWTPKGLVQRAARLPAVKRPIGLYDPSLVHANSWMGRAFVGFRRLMGEIGARSDVAFKKLNSLGQPFKLGADGHEVTSGKFLGDLHEGWWAPGEASRPLAERVSGFERDAFVARISADELARYDEYMDAVNTLRLDAIEDAKVLGQRLPDNWLEDLHAFRQVMTRKGFIDVSAIRTSSRVPSSFKHRYYELMAEGFANGVNYRDDFSRTVAAGAHAIRQYAAEQSFLQFIKANRGVPLKLFVAQEKRLNKAVATRDFGRAKQMIGFVKASLRGEPARPIMREGKLMQAIPQEIQDVISETVATNKRLAGAGAKVKRTALEGVRARAEAIHAKYSAEVKKARYDLRVARESIDQSYAPAAKFNKPGDWVEVSPAPFRVIPQLQGSLYLKEDVDFLVKHYAKSSNPMVQLARSTKDWAGFLRATQTTYDAGYLMIQGLGPLSVDMANVARGRAPGQLWGRSTWRALVGIFNDAEASKWFRQEIEKNPELYKEYMTHVRSAGLSEDLGPVGMLERAEQKIGLKFGPAKLVNRGFSNFLDSAGWNTWKSLRPLAKTTEDLEELGSFVRNILGKNSMEQLGMSEGQLMLERVMLYAPSFTRAGLAIMAKAMFDPLSFGGRQALKSIAGMAAVMGTLVVAGNLFEQLYEHNGDPTKIDWDDLADEVKRSFDITAGSKFGSFRMGNVRYGFGGNLRTNFTLMGNLIHDGFDDPKNLSPWDPDSDTAGRWGLNWSNPVMRHIRGKLHPAPGAALDILMGRDYIGHEMDSPRDIFDQTWRRALPISLQNVLQSDLGLKETLAIGTAEFMGARSTPVSKGDLFKEQVERDLGDTYENIKTNEPDLLSLASQDEEHYPELVQKRKDWENDKRSKGNKWQVVRDFTEKRKVDRDKELAQLASEIDWNIVGGAEKYREQSKIIRAKYFDDFKNEVERQGLKLDDAPEDDKDASLHDQLNQVDLEDYKLPDGKPDYDAFKAARNRIISQMTPREQQAVRDKRYSYKVEGLSEIEQRKDRAADLWGPYKNAPKYKGTTNKESDQVDGILDGVKQLRALIELKTGKSAPSMKKLLKRLIALHPGDDRLLTIAYISSFDALKPLIMDDTKRKLVMDNPDFAIFYPSVFYDLNEDDQEAWKKRWGGNANRGVTIDTTQPFDAESGGEGY